MFKILQRLAISLRINFWILLLSFEDQHNWLHSPLWGLTSYDSLCHSLLSSLIAPLLSLQIQTTQPLPQSLWMSTSLASNSLPIVTHWERNPSLSSISSLLKCHLLKMGFLKDFYNKNPHFLYPLALLYFSS